MIRSRVGLGSATVETVLPDEAFSPGDAVEATVEVTGGESDQHIERFYFSIAATADVGDDDQTYVIDTFDVLEEFVIEADDTERIPVEIAFPTWTPITGENVSVRIDVGADIPWSVDPHDTIAVEIVPDPLLAATLEATGALGFEFERSRIHDVDWRDDRPFVQIFEFSPGDEYADRVETLFITSILEADRLLVHVEIDRVDAVAAEYGLDFNKDELPFAISKPDPGVIQGRLRNEIEQHS